MSIFPHPNRGPCEPLADGVANGAIKANVAAVIPLSRTAEAHGLLEQRKVQGIVVLDPRA